MAVLLLALLELDDTHDLKILFICKENSGTRSFADLLQWLAPPQHVSDRIGRLVGDQERNKSSYSQTISLTSTQEIDDRSSANVNSY